MSDPILNCQVNILSMSPNFLFALQINPQAPVAQKIADKVVFRRFQGEGVEFFVNRTSLIPVRSLMRSFGKYRFKPLLIHFSVGFISRACFESDDFIAYSNEGD